jgi:immunity protein, SdpI family
MTRKTASLIILLLTAAALACTLLLYPSLPQRMPIHWDVNGHVDGWGEKMWSAFFGPGLLLALLLGLWAMPWLSPTGFKLEPFAPTFHWIVVLCGALAGFLHVVTLHAALQGGADRFRLVVSGILVFLALLGNVLGKVRRNFWVGIRTPWALADEAVWIATHRLAARLVFGLGLAGAVAIWLGAPPLACLAALMLGLVVPAAYSLVLSKRREGGAPS